MEMAVLLRYPEYGRFDCIQSANEKDLIVEHLAELFPLFEDRDGLSQRETAWDQRREYEVSRLTVYVPRYELGQADTADICCSSLEEWIASCKEQWILDQGAALGEAPEGGSEAEGTEGRVLARRRSTFEAVRSKQQAREQRLQRSSAAPGSAFYEVHLGCSLRRIASAAGVVLSAGVLRLVVFPTDGLARAEFLRRVRKEGGEDAIKQLLPAS